MFSLLGSPRGFAALAAASTVAIVASMSSAFAQEQQRSFNIPEQPLSSALIEFSRQADVPVGVDPVLVNGKQAPAVQGTFTPSEALNRLLVGSGLAARLRPEGGFVLTDASPTRLGDAREAAPSEALVEEEIVVTGTHIRGIGGSVGTPISLITREDILRSGQATTQDVIKTSPLIFQGGASEDSRVGGSAANNAFFGSGVDLRGLGTAATLTLLNGRRLPLAGGAAFVDVSSIPASAIERIEILPDGASALYGSDAIGGVINIILREDYEGAETTGRVGVPTEGGGEDWLAGQTFGANWDSGHALLALEHYNRERLENADRSFSRSADLRPLGGDDFRNTASNPGNILSPFTGLPAFAIPPGQDGTSLEVSDLLPDAVNRNNQNETADLMPRQRRTSVFGAASQDIGSNTELFIEGRYSLRKFQSRTDGFGTVGTALFVPSSNPFFVDPFGFGFTFVSYNFLDDLGPAVFEGEVETYSGAAGVEQRLWDDWRLRAYGSYSRELSNFTTRNIVNSAALSAALADPDPETAFNPFGDGSNTNPATIEKIRGFNMAGLDSRIWSVNAIADGTIVTLPGGDLKLAAGLDYREEQFNRSLTPPALGIGEIPTDRNVLALFGEIYAPLVGAENEAPGFHRLTLSAAVRYDQYGGVGPNEATTNPKFGLLWAPVEGLNLRASYGTSFVAPKLVDLDESFNAAIAFPLPDPSAPGGTTLSLLRQGNNSDLRNETAETWSLGFEIAPLSIPGFKLALNYFDIDYNDRIASPALTTTILTQPERFASIIIRDPSPEQIAEICNSPEFARLGGDPATCVLLPIEAIVDARLNNTASTKVQGVDFTLNFSFPTRRFGRFDLSANGVYFLSYDESFSAGSPSIEILDTVGNPVGLRMRNSIVWTGPGGLRQLHRRLCRQYQRSRAEDRFMDDARP